MDRVKGWVDNGKLHKRPDPVTGSEEDHMAEFKVPQQTDRSVGSDEHTAGYRATADINKEEARHNERL